MAKVQSMEWKDAHSLVKRRLDKLAMCKRGVLMTEINKLVEDLGEAPSYTDEERERINAALLPRIRKALTPTAAMMKRHGSSTRLIALIQNECRNKATKIEEGRYNHPARPAYDKKIKAVHKQQDERLAELDSEFQDVLDSFTLGTLDISDFPQALEKLETRSW